jgi:hypothetical protein
MPDWEHLFLHAAINVLTIPKGIEQFGIIAFLHQLDSYEGFLLACA